MSAYQYAKQAGPRRFSMQPHAEKWLAIRLLLIWRVAWFFVQLFLATRWIGSQRGHGEAEVVGRALEDSSNAPTHREPKDGQESYEYAINSTQCRCRCE